MVARARRRGGRCRVARRAGILHVRRPRLQRLLSSVEPPAQCCPLPVLPVPVPVLSAGSLHRNVAGVDSRHRASQPASSPRRQGCALRRPASCRGRLPRPGPEARKLSKKTFEASRARGWGHLAPRPGPGREAKADLADLGRLSPLWSCAARPGLCPRAPVRAATRIGESGAAGEPPARRERRERREAMIWYGMIWYGMVSSRNSSGVH